MSVSHAPMIGLLTDFGQADGYVGTMKAVMLGIAPGMPLVDLSHDIPAQDIATGAWTLGAAWRYFPEGSVLLCVVDPGVGSARRAVALEAGGRRFVGPDNGLFTHPLLAAGGAVGGEARCVSLDRPAYHLAGASATFHGRDIFAPCAAWLASGTPLDALGSAVEIGSLVTLREEEPRRDGQTWIARVAHVDHYGNLITSLGPDLTQAALASAEAAVRVSGHTIRQRATHFAAGPGGEPFWLQDSSGALAVAVKDGSAAQMLGTRRGDEVTLTYVEGNTHPDK